MMNSTGELKLSTYHFQGLLKVMDIRGTMADQEIDVVKQASYTMLYPLSTAEAVPTYLADSKPVVLNVIHNMKQGEFQQQLAEGEINWSRVRLMAITVISPVWSWQKFEGEMEESTVLEKYNDALDQVDFFSYINRYESLRCLGNRFENKVRKGKTSFQMKGVRFHIGFTPSLEDYAYAWGEGMRFEQYLDVEERMEAVALEHKTPKEEFLGVCNGSHYGVPRILRIGNIRQVIYTPPGSWSNPSRQPGQLTLITEEGEIDFCEIYADQDEME